MLGQRATSRSKSMQGSNHYFDLSESLDIPNTNTTTKTPTTCLTSTAREETSLTWPRTVPRVCLLFHPSYIPLR